MLIDLLWKISLQGAVFAGIVWIVSRLARNAPARVRHALWVLVLVKFLIPPFAYVPAEWAFWQRNEKPAPPQAVVVAPSMPPPSSEPPASVQPAPAPIAPSVSAPAPEEVRVPIDWPPIVWLSGASLMFLLLVVRAFRQFGLVRRSAVADESLQSMLADAAGRMRASRIPRLRVSDRAPTPMLVGVVRPTVLLPRGIDSTCTSEALNAMLMHEIAHIKRRDMLVLWFHQLVQVLFFFHPAVWLAGRELKRERELACDELVLSTSGISAKDYAAGYIAALKLAGATSPMSLGMAEPFEAEKSRVQRILAHRPARRGVRWMALVIVIAAVGLPTCAGLIGAAGRSAGQARAIPPSWPTALPMDAEGILLQPGTYRMEWKDLSDIGEMTERYGFHRANDPISPTFLGVHSTRFLWSRAGNYLAVLDEDRGTGSGYDVIYLIPHLHSAPVSRAVKASISDGLRVPLKPYRPTARPVYRRTLKVAYSERPWLVPAEARPVVVDVRLGGPESTVVRKSELEIAVYQWKDHPGWIKAAPKYGWRGMVKTNAGLRIVAPVNSVGNGIYGDTVLLQMPGGSAEDLSCGRFYTYGAGVYSFGVSRDGSVLEVRSDEGREQAKIGAVLAELGKALRVGDTSTAADLFLTNFKQNLKSTTVEAFLKHAPVGKPDWRTALASSTAKTGQVHIFGLNADVMVLTQGQSPETSPAVDVNMVNENGKWLISSEPGGPYQPMREFSTPQYGNVGLEVVALIPADGTITAGEPLVAKLELKNLTQKTLYVHGNSLLSTRLEVYDSKGELVGATPVEPLPPDMIVGQVKVAPHESLIRRMVLSSLYRFVAAGEYTVRIQLLNLDTSRSVGAATETRVRVLPFDSRHLSQRCEEIFAPLRSFGNSRTIPSGLGDFPLQLRLQALYSIRSDEVLPYLSLIAREWDRTSEQWPAMTMIRRIGTPKAKALFSSLAARQDHVGEVARMVAKEPVRDQVDEWYVGDDWHRP